MTKSEKENKCKLFVSLLQGRGLTEINMQIVHVSLFLPCPRVPLIVLSIATIIQSPDTVQILGLLVILHLCIVSVCFFFFNFWV